MASPESFNSSKGKGYPVDKHNFTSLDGLESKEDLKVLFEVLKSI
jgi:hypothetical protein